MKQFRTVAARLQAISRGKVKYLFAMMFVVVGVTILSAVNAATFTVNQEAEKGVRVGAGATIVTDTTASGGQAVKFGPATQPPVVPPTPPPPGPGGVSLLKPATTFKTYDNLRYSDSSTRSLLNLYTPENGVAAAPVIIYIHGGGWSSGSKDQYCLPYITNMMYKGFAVACINYRYTDEAPFPAQIEDVKASIRYLRANAATYKLFDDRIGIWGASAGGHLAAMAGTTSNYKPFDVGPNLTFSSSVQAVVDDFGPTDMTVWANSPCCTVNQGRYSMVGKLLGAAVLDAPDKAKAANPITYIDSTDPPFVIMHGDADTVVPLNQSVLLDEALKKANVPSNFTVVPGMVHGGAPSYSTARIAEMTTYFDGLLR